MHLEVRSLLEALEGELRQPVLAEMNVVGMRSDGRQGLYRERDPLLRPEDEVVVVLFRKAERSGFLQQAEPLQSLEHGPVIDGRAWRVDDVGLALDESDPDAGLRQTQRSEQADGACADDQHFILSHEQDTQAARSNRRPKQSTPSPPDAGRQS